MFYRPRPFHIFHLLMKLLFSLVQIKSDMTTAQLQRPDLT